LFNYSIMAYVVCHYTILYYVIFIVRYNYYI